jgi:cell division protein ZapA
MPETAITLNGRIYRFSCGEADAPRLRELSQVVASKLDALVAEYGQVGDDRLLLMSALQIADELLEARARAAALESASAVDRKPPRAGGV